MSANNPAEANTPAFMSSQGKKNRKPYTITKPRESWTKEEHSAFLDAVRQHERDWKRIGVLIPTKSIIQIRSHAQKYFIKMAKAGMQQYIPPPRPKKWGREGSEREKRVRRHHSEGSESDSDDSNDGSSGSQSENQSDSDNDQYENRGESSGNSSHHHTPPSASTSLKVVPIAPFGNAERGLINGAPGSPGNYPEKSYLPGKKKRRGFEATDIKSQSHDRSRTSERVKRPSLKRIEHDQEPMHDRASSSKRFREHQKSKSGTESEGSISEAPSSERDSSKKSKGRRDKHQKHQRSHYSSHSKNKSDYWQWQSLVTNVDSSQEMNPGSHFDDQAENINEESEVDDEQDEEEEEEEVEAEEEDETLNSTVPVRLHESRRRNNQNRRHAPLPHQLSSLSQLSPLSQLSQATDVLDSELTLHKIHALNDPIDDNDSNSFGSNLNHRHLYSNFNNRKDRDESGGVVESVSTSQSRPEFSKVYAFLGALFDPSKTSGHMEELEKMTPMNREIAHALMQNLTNNLQAHAQIQNSSVSESNVPTVNVSATERTSDSNNESRMLLSPTTPLDEYPSYSVKNESEFVPSTSSTSNITSSSHSFLASTLSPAPLPFPSVTSPLLSSTSVATNENSNQSNVATPRSPIHRSAGYTSLFTPMSSQPIFTPSSNFPQIRSTIRQPSLALSLNIPSSSPEPLEELLLESPQAENTEAPISSITEL